MHSKSNKIKATMRLAAGIGKEALAHPMDTSVFDIESGKLVGRREDGKILSSDTDMLIAALFNQERLLILKSLAEKPLRISQLEEVTGKKRTTICFHLGVLADAGLVTSKYEVLEAPTERGPGRAASVWVLNIDAYKRGLKATQKLLVANLREDQS